MRKRVVFWLDEEKEEELALLQQVKILKSKRSFARTIRDGIRLVCDLRNGKMNVLKELFPWVVDELAAPPIDKESLVSDIVFALGKGEIGGHANPRVATNDFAIDVKASTSSENNNASYNFLISSAALMGDYSSLPDDAFDYGIRTGRIPSHEVQKRTKVEKGPKKMDVPQFDVPVIEVDL